MSSGLRGYARRGHFAWYRYERREIPGGGSRCFPTDCWRFAWARQGWKRRFRASPETSLQLLLTWPSQEWSLQLQPFARTHVHKKAPTIIENAAAVCALDIPRNVRGLMRMNSTRNRATPVSTK